MHTIDDLTEAAAKAIAEQRARPVAVLSPEYHMHVGLGGVEALGVDTEQWYELIEHVRVALAGDEVRLEIPLPAAVVTAAALLDVPGADVQSLHEDIDQEVYASRDQMDQLRTDVAYERAGYLADSLRHLLRRVTTIRPRWEEERPGYAESLVAAADSYRIALDRSEHVQEALYGAICREAAAGRSQIEIARITGLGKSRVSQIVRRGGV